MMRTLHVILLLLSVAAPAAAEPLPSWSSGGVRDEILAWVAAVTDTASADHIPPAERIAVLDNDGTSWCERPTYGATDFQISMARNLAARGIVDGEAMPFRAWFTDDRDALRQFGYEEAYEQMNAAFAGMPVAAYRDSALAWLRQTPHPRYRVPLTDLYYSAMLELKDLLLANGFEVWIVTGAEQDFVRSFSEQVLGIPPGRVIGTWTQPVYVESGGHGELVRGDHQNPNGYENKPASIQTRIGRRPVFAAGNSNNDQAMLTWTLSGPRRGFGLWIHHDDAEREYAYDRGTDRMVRVVQEHPDAHEVSMKREWVRLFAQDGP